MKTIVRIAGFESSLTKIVVDRIRPWNDGSASYVLQIRTKTSNRVTDIIKDSNDQDAVFAQFVQKVEAAGKSIDREGQQYLQVAYGNHVIVREFVLDKVTEDFVRSLGVRR
jgi:hypothetical protein